MNTLLIFTLCLGSSIADQLVKRGAFASAGDSFASASAGEAVAVAGDDSRDFMSSRRGRRFNFRQ
jgi:hypothetical protein